MRRSTESSAEAGQTLILAVGIVVILAMGVVVVVLLNQTGIRHQTASHKQSQGRSGAEEGLAYASQILSADPATWNAALQGNFPLSDECTSSARLTNVPGTNFRLKCANYNVANAALYPGLQPYQVAVVATAWMKDSTGQLVPAGSVQSYISQKTAGASLSSGVRAPAALELVTVPNLQPDTLVVHWGPIVCIDNAQWVLVNPLDQSPAGVQGFPRKFSAGGITGSGAAPLYPRAPTAAGSSILTDQKEFWAFDGMSFPVLVNEYAYQSAAILENLMPTNVPCIPAGAGNCNITQTGNGVYGVGQGTAVFNNGFNMPVGTNIIYVDGSARFDNLQLDLPTGGAMIITGDLTLGDPTIAPGPIILKIPPTAPQEYPYWPPATKWPCQDQCIPAGMICSGLPLTCTAAPQAGILTGVNFRGFLWVKGSIHVIQPAGQPPWTIAGTVVVGDVGTGTGTLITNPGSRLQIFYDATVNHAIQVNPS